MKKDYSNYKERRMWGDVIEMFKIYKGFDNINAEEYFTVDRSNITRKQNSFKIIDKILVKQSQTLLQQGR